MNFDSAFNLDNVETINLKFLAFGFEASDGLGGFKSLPHFTYVLDCSIEIISPIEGIVASVHLQNEITEDYAIWLKPHGGPTLWLVEIDHITKLTVEEGDAMFVSDKLPYVLFARHRRTSTSFRLD